MRKKINKEKTTKGKKYSFKEKLKEKFCRVGLNYIFTFGKYEGRNCERVCELESQYIRWCMQKKILDFEEEVINYMIKCEHERKEEQARRERVRKAEQKFYEKEANKKWQAEENARRSRWQNFSERTFHQQAHRIHRSEKQFAKVKIVSPATKWDHLPDKIKYGRILGIHNLQVTKQEIRVLYKKRMLEYHHDKCESLGEEIKRLSHEMTLRINEAYEYFQRTYNV